jgi:hypothetical protein
MAKNVFKSNYNMSKLNKGVIMLENMKNEISIGISKMCKTGEENTQKFKNII